MCIQSNHKIMAIPVLIWDFLTILLFIVNIFFSSCSLLSCARSAHLKQSAVPKTKYLIGPKPGVDSVINNGYLILWSYNQSLWHSYIIQHTACTHIYTHTQTKRHTDRHTPLASCQIILQLHKQGANKSTDTGNKSCKSWQLCWCLHQEGWRWVYCRSGTFVFMQHIS